MQGIQPILGTSRPPILAGPTGSLLSSALLVPTPTSQEHSLSQKWQLWSSSMLMVSLCT